MDLKKISDDVGETFAARSRFLHRCSLGIKAILVAGMSALATAAQFAEFPETGSPSAWKLVGIIAAVLAGIGAIYVIITEKDASSELEMARKAVEAARSNDIEFDHMNNAFDALKESLQRTVELSNMNSLSREILEQMLFSDLRDEDRIVHDLMTYLKQPLPVALGFAQADQWTIGLYKAAQNLQTGAMELRCIANQRAIDCELRAARVWPTGVGVAGFAYAGDRDVVVPDLRDDRLGSIFDFRSLRKSEDSERYVSAAASPIRVAKDKRPWGVVIATSDQANHFYLPEEKGITTADVVKALAEIAALGVVISRSSKFGIESAIAATGKEGVHEHG